VSEAVIRRATARDATIVLGLVREAGLAIPGVVEHLSAFVVAERGERAVGTIGLELRGEVALLRSAVVAPAERGAGLGGVLVSAILDLARSEGVATLYLLTTSAEGYWRRHGFSTIAREDIPDAVRESAEFAGACPTSAVAMARSL
jgi:amino-acid N-acetyltransferase